MNHHRGRRWRAARNLGLALAALLTAAGTAAAAGDRVVGRDKATACQACHGLDGLSRQPDAPNIAGQNALYMRAQLRAYRSGKRHHPVMTVVAKGLSDADIDDLTAHYASIKITVEMPE